MGVGKSAALAVAIFGGTLFGAWLGPYLSDRAQAMDKQTAMLSTPIRAPSAPATEPGTYLDRSQADTNPTSKTSLSVQELQKHFRPLLGGGADLKLATAGFQTIEDFAAVAHASRNIRVPFAMVKHQVVDEGKTLAAAIHAVKPTADALLEADLARSEARSDLAVIR